MKKYNNSYTKNNKLYKYRKKYNTEKLHRT